VTLERARDAMRELIKTKKKEMVLYVAPNGDDAWSGRLAAPDKNKTNGPFASITRARDAIRKIKKEESGLKKPITVMVREGTYFLSEPITFTPEDSGTKECPITYTVYPGEKVIINGGKIIKGEWKRYDKKLWMIHLPEVKQGRWYFRQLFVNGEPRRIARLPKEGFMKHESTSKQAGGANEGWKIPDPEECTTLVYAKGQLSSSLSFKNADFTIYHSWDVSQTKAVAHDVATRTLRLNPPCHGPVGSFHVQDYIVENIREGMLEPGQWYLDHDAGCVVYWPFEGEDLSKIVIEAGVTGSILQIQGNSETPVRELHLRNFTIDLTGTCKGNWGGWGAGLFDGAIFLEYVKGCSLNNLTICRVGGSGIKIRHASDTAVNNCHIHHTGSCGILLMHGERNSVLNNLVHDVGLLFPHAIGISLSSLKHSRIGHNEVCNIPYSGISLGNGMMDLEPAENILEYNHISEVMTGMNDGGCIYIFGREKGTLIRGNVLSKAYGRTNDYCMGLYLDEISQDIICEDNVVHSIAGRPLHLHITKDHIIRNNIFICNSGNIISLQNSEQALLEKNIFYAPAKGIVFQNAPRNNFRNNLYFFDKELRYESQSLGLRPFIGRKESLLPMYDIVQIGKEDADFEDLIRKAPSYPDEISRKLSNEAPLAPRMLGSVPFVTVVGTYPDEMAWEKALILPEMRDNRGYNIEMIRSDTRLLYGTKYLYIRGIFHNHLLPPEPDSDDQPVSAHVTLRPENKDNIRITIEVKRCGETSAFLHPEGKPVAID